MILSCVRNLDLLMAFPVTGVKTVEGAMNIRVMRFVI